MSETDYVVWFIFMGAATAAILFVVVGIAGGAFGTRRHVNRPAGLTRGEQTPVRQPPHPGDVAADMSPQTRLDEREPAHTP